MTNQEFFYGLTEGNQITYNACIKLNSRYCAIWHEAIAGRSDQNVVDSILMVFDRERDVEHFTLWTDN